MVANTNSSRTRLLHVLLVAVVCVSVFYVSDGNKTSKKRKATSKAKLEVRKYCRAMKWFDKRQRSMCTKSPKLIELVRKGIENGLTECRRQFKDYRWNCSPLTWSDVLLDEAILKKRSRETAFVQALTTASVMIELAKSCATGIYEHCGCGKLPKHSRRRTPGKFTWDGCFDNFSFGAQFAKRFLGPKKINNHSKKSKSHNQEAGRAAVRDLKIRKCRCHGKSDTCTYKTCWYIAPDVSTVGDHIWQLYQSSIQSQWNRTENRLYDKDRPKREKAKDAKNLHGKLTYFSKSENFCVQNLPMGVMGTYGRICNSTSLGNNGCDTMCCGRSYKRTFITTKEKCNCKFVWCCNVHCEECNKTRVVETCQ